MHKKLASSLVLALAMVGSTIAPAMADDDSFKGFVQIPWRIAGSGVGLTVGMPEGAVKDGTKGAIKATKVVAKGLGNEDGKYQRCFGFMVGAPFGIIGGAAYGVFDGGLHGIKTGYKQPFSKDAFTFKED